MSETLLSRPFRQRGLVLMLGALLLFTFGLSLYFYFTGDDHTLPVGTVAQLTPIPVQVAPAPAGPADLAVQANGYLVTQTRDVGGPVLWPAAAWAWVAVLGLVLSVWLAVVSTLARPGFIAGTALTIFLLMSLNADLLEVFGQKQYFLVLALAVLAGSAFALHAFFEQVGLGARLLLFLALVAGLGAFLFIKSPHPAHYTALHLAAYGSLAGLAAIALLAVWVSIELIFGLLWLNTNGPTPKSRFGLLPFVLSSLLLLAIPLLYYWNGGRLAIFPGVQLEPYLLLLLAVAVGWWGLARRQATYASWLPYSAAAPLYLALGLLALISFGYAAATANGPFLNAGRHFIILALGIIGGVFFLYVLLNFAPLIRQRLRVYQVAFEPRRMPFYLVYILGIGLIGAVLMRNNFELLDQARAGQYVQLGDLTRYHSEQQPDNLYLALLAERYYAEADQLDPRNSRGALGRAALYQTRSQRQNEINILRTTLLREPNEKVLLRLAARFDQPTDFFDRQQVLRQAVLAYPASGLINAEFAQLYTRSSLSDSVLHYFRRAVAADANDPLLQSNWLAFLLKNKQLQAAAQAVAKDQHADWPAWHSNALLLRLLQGKHQEVATAKVSVDTALTHPQFAQLYHLGLAQAARRDTAGLPLLQRLQQVRANDSYADQLAFLSGLVQLRSARPSPGFDLLEALATGDSRSYYQQLLGQYLLERNLYRSAAARFALAEEAGNPAALVARAYALQWAGQSDSAQAIARRILRTDSASSQGARILLAGQATRPTRRRPQARQYMQAATAAQQNRTDEAARLFRRAFQADPFDEQGVLEAAEFFAKRQDPITSYEIMRRALSYNPESVTMLQRFVLAAADAGLEDYAAAALAKLNTLLRSPEYLIFHSQYDKRRAAHRAAVAPWN